MWGCITYISNIYIYMANTGVWRLNSAISIHQVVKILEFGAMYIGTPKPMEHA